MTTTAPMFAPDLELSDPDEMLKVTNNSSKPLEWVGVRRIYRIMPGKTEFVPFHICIRYMGDPRSAYKKVESYETPTGVKGVIPERRGELIRLAVFYGLYHGQIKQLPKHAPKVTIVTTNDVPIIWPISEPQGPSFKYQTSRQSNIDVRTELEHLQAQMQQLAGRQDSILEHLDSEDPDSDEPPEDSPLGL